MTPKSVMKIIGFISKSWSENVIGNLKIKLEYLITIKIIYQAVRKILGMQILLLQSYISLHQCHSTLCT